MSWRAQQSGYRRTTLYHHAQRVAQAVFNEQASGISYETLWETTERLQAENEALWQAWGDTDRDVVGDGGARWSRVQSDPGGTLGAAGRGASQPAPDSWCLPTKQILPGEG